VTLNLETVTVNQAERCIRSNLDVLLIDVAHHYPVFMQDFERDREIACRLYKKGEVSLLKMFPATLRIVELENIVPVYEG
jgi:hypothetical protein